MATYAYIDTTGRKLTQSEYDTQAQAGTDVSKYTKIEPNVATSTTTQPTIPVGTPTVLPQTTQTVPTVDPMAKIKELPLYSELLKKWYTEEQISKAVSWYKPPKRRERTVTPPAEVETETPATVVVPTTTTTAKPEEIEATTTDKTQQTLAPLPLSEYKDDSETRQSQIVNNLNSYRQSSPAYMKDLDTFRKTFSYGLRSDTQRTLLDNWYLGYQKWLELNSKNTSDLSSLYINGNISDSDLEQLRLQNPNKYSEVMALNDKNSTLAKYGDELNGKETSINPFQSIINNYASNMLSMSTAPSNMFAEYKAAMNSEEMKGMQSQLTDKEWEIKQLDLQINQLTSDVKSRYEGTGATISKINAIIADETSALQELRNAKAIDYQTLAKKYQNQMTSITDSFDMQIKEQEYNNSQRNQQMQELWFMMELQNYETNEQADEREWNKFIRQQEYQDGNIYSSDPATRRKAIEKSVDRVLAEFEGIPMLRSREEMVADIQKMVDNGTELGEAITQNIRKPIMWKPEYNLWKKNKLGIDTTPIDIGWSYYTQNADGSLSLWKGYNMQGTINWATYTAVNPTTVQAAVQQISAQWDGSVWGQCGSFVNDYLQDIWLSRMFKDPITQKESLVNTQTPSIWSIVVMNSPVAKEYWHVGIVTSVNSDWTITIKNSNWGWDKKVTTNTLSQSSSQIIWYFDPTLWGSSSVSGWATPTAAELLYFKDGKIKKKATDEWLTEQRYNEIAKIQQSNAQTSGQWQYDAEMMQSLELPEKATEFSKKSLSYGNRLALSNEKIKTYEDIFVSRNRWSQWFQTTAPNRLKSQDQKSYELYKENFITANLRQESWAAIAPTEFEKEEKKYFAQVWDSTDVVEQKRKMRELAVKNMYMQSWRDINWIPIVSYYNYWNEEQSDTTTSNTGATKNYFATYKTVTPTKTTSTSYSSSPYFNYISGY